MFCKFCAEPNIPMSTLQYTRIPLLLLSMALAAGSACAEKADRNQAMTLESDQPCKVDLGKQESLCSGNVVISQGSLLIRADRLELRETAQGYQVALALGTASKPASYRQKRDGSNEIVEGQAQRIDYDSRLGTIRFEGQAQVRRLQGSTVADEMQGAVIVWDSQAETLHVQGGSRNDSNPSGRVRAVIAPRVPVDAASATPAAAPAAPLKPSPGIGDRR